MPAYAPLPASTPDSPSSGFDREHENRVGHCPGGIDQRRAAQRRRADNHRPTWWTRASSPFVVKRYMAPSAEGGRPLASTSNGLSDAAPTEGVARQRRPDRRKQQ